MKRLLLLVLTAVTAAIMMNSCQKIATPSAEGVVTTSLGESPTIEMPIAAGSETFTIETNVPWHIELRGVLVDSKADSKATGWVEVSPMSGAAGSHTITVSADENTMGTARTLILALVAGDPTITTKNTTQEITVTQARQPAIVINSFAGSANSGMVAPGETVSFDIDLEARTWGSLPKPTMPDFTTALTAELLWAEGIDEGSITPTLDKDNKILIVRTSAGSNGNAAVALKDAFGVILWSWHVWVTDYDVRAVEKMARDTVSTYSAGVANGVVHTYSDAFFTANGAETTKNIVIMDRNLGATWTGSTPVYTPDDEDKSKSAYGLYYQWGRKDPFKTFGAVDSKGGAQSLEYATQNPDKFIYITNIGKDWNIDSNYELWGNNSSATKSPYDPCPKGWRVPKDGTWTGFDTGPKDEDDNITEYTYIKWRGGTEADPYAGLLYTAGGTSVAAWYPASGCRIKGGAHSKVGEDGGNWSSVVAINPAGNGYDFGLGFTFWAAAPYPSGTSYLTNGFPVRCLQE